MTSSLQGKLISSLMKEILEMEECQAICDRATMSAAMAISRRRNATREQGVEEPELLVDTFPPHKLRPASKEALTKLPKCRVLPSHKERTLDADRTCGVCCGRWVDGMLLTRLPCGHVYHLNCIVPWFSMTNSCPECRYEIATCDESYETVRQTRMSNRTTVSCTCDPRMQRHTCFFDDSKLVLHGGEQQH